MRKTFEDFAALKVDLTGKLDGFNLDLQRRCYIDDMA